MSQTCELKSQHQFSNYSIPRNGTTPPVYYIHLYQLVEVEFFLTEKNWYKSNNRLVEGKDYILNYFIFIN